MGAEEHACRAGGRGTTRPAMKKLLAPSLLALIACGGGAENLPPPPPQPKAAVEPPKVVASAPPSASAPVVEPPPVAPPSLGAGTAAPDPAAPLPTVKIVAPAANLVIPAAKAKDFEIKLDVKDWKTAAGDAHVHLILDNKPYMRIDDPKAPVKLSQFGAELAEGQHVLVAFPSRATHESVKTKGAVAVVSFYVGKKDKDAVDVKKPLLVYSRPKGEYNGAMANHVLVDWQVANAEIGDGKFAVSLAVTGPGISAPLTAKQTNRMTPFYLDHLQNGTYTVKTELLDKDGKVVPGAWNSTTRDIKIDGAAPTPADPHAGHGSPPPAAPPSK